MNRHYVLLFALALLVGGLYIGPQLLIREQLKEKGEPHIILQLNKHSDETNIYLPRAQEVYNGHWPPRDLHFKDGSPSAFPALPSLLAGSFIGLAGGNVNSAFLALNFVFPALAFLLFYLTAWVLTKNKLWSVFVGLAGVLTPVALHLPRAFKGLGLFGDIVAKNFVPIIRTPLDVLFLSRFDDPLLTLGFYLAAITSLYLFWSWPSVKRAVWAGLWAGLLFHVYLYYSFYWLAVVGLLFIYVLLFKRGDRPLIKNLLTLIAVMALVSAPYFINYINLKGLDSYQDYVFRVGTEVGRGFRLASVWFEYLAYLILAALVWLFYWKKKKEKQKAVLFWVFILALFLVWNIQLLTGFVPHPGHWRKAAAPILFFILTGFAFDFYAHYQSRLKPAAKKLAAGLLILASLLLVAKKAANVWAFKNLPQDELKRYSFNKDIYDSWDWINSNLKGEPAILTNSFLTSVYLSGYTAARVYLPMAQFTSRANAELEERYLAASKVFGVPENRLRYNLAATDDPFYLYSSFYREKNFDYAFTSSDKSVPQEKIEELVARYQALIVSLTDIEADYIYYGPWEKETALADFKTDPRLELVYSNPSVEIYKISK